jgi:AraC-like DNA-binding protein
MPSILADRRGAVLYVPDMGRQPDRAEIRAWRPAIDGVVEVLHARFSKHAYPMHTHDAWTLLIIDDGVVRFDLDRHEHGAARDLVTLLPPHVAHDGRSVVPSGFRKRVVYLDETLVDPTLIGPSVDHPGLRDALLRDRIDRLHVALSQPGDELEAQSRLCMIVERLGEHLGGAAAPHDVRDRGIAGRLREVLDANIVGGVSLTAASAAFGVHPTHLVRAFRREYGMPPHRYVLGRRLDDARRLLLSGWPAADVATATGFYDQAHFTRHFRRLLGTSPVAYARSSLAEAPGPLVGAPSPSVIRQANRPAAGGT